MRILATLLFTINIATFAVAMRGFSAPRGWPLTMRLLSAIGALSAGTALWSLIQWPASTPRLVAAVSLALVSQALFRWGIGVAMQHRFAVAFSMTEPGPVVCDGPYRWLHHPLYVAYALNWAAAAAASRHWLPLVGGAVMSAFYVIAARGEDRVLGPRRTQRVPTRHP